MIQELTCICSSIDSLPFCLVYLRDYDNALGMQVSRAFKDKRVESGRQMRWGRQTDLIPLLDQSTVQPRDEPSLYIVKNKLAVFGR